MICQFVRFSHWEEYINAGLCSREMERAGETAEETKLYCKSHLKINDFFLQEEELVWDLDKHKDYAYAKTANLLTTSQ